VKICCTTKKHISDIFCYLWLFFRRKLTRVTRVESPRISELYQRAGLSRNELYMPKNWLNPIGIFLLKQMLSYLSLFQDGCLIRRDWERGGWGRGNFFGGVTYCDYKILLSLLFGCAAIFFVFWQPHLTSDISLRILKKWDNRYLGRRTYMKTLFYFRKKRQKLLLLLFSLY
jgi:hypothetical protein